MIFERKYEDIRSASGVCVPGQAADEGGCALHQSRRAKNIRRRWKMEFMTEIKDSIVRNRKHIPMYSSPKVGMKSNRLKPLIGPNLRDGQPNQRRLIRLFHFDL